MNKIMIVVNHPITLYRFRRELVNKLIEDSYDVTLLSPEGEYIDEVINLGVKHIKISMDRRGMNIFKDLRTYKELKSIISKVKPDVVLTYTIKPNIYAGLVCNRLGIPFIANVTGLGSAYNKSSTIKKVVNTLYKRTLRKAQRVFVQNQSNYDYFIKHNISKDNVELIPGSGVNVDENILLDYPDNNEKIVFSFIGRIMKEKGVDELLHVAIKIQEETNSVMFNFVGFYEDNYKQKIQTLANEGLIKYHGYLDDIKPLLRNSHAVVNPSYHEGMSNVLLEAAATGRPVIASNIPGCKETFEEGTTGFGFEPKNEEDLYRAIMKFLNLTYEEKKKMGVFGRKKVVNEFDRKIVVNRYINEIENTLNGEN